MAKAYFVYAGNRRMYEDKIEIVQVLEILKHFKNLIGMTVGGVDGKYLISVA